MKKVMKNGAERTIFSVLLLIFPAKLEKKKIVLSAQNSFNFGQGYIPEAQLNRNTSSYSNWKHIHYKHEVKQSPALSVFHLTVEVNSPCSIKIFFFKVNI